MPNHAVVLDASYHFSRLADHSRGAAPNFPRDHGLCRIIMLLILVSGGICGDPPSTDLPHCRESLSINGYSCHSASPRYGHQA